MEFKDFLAYYCDRSNAMETFWNFYLVVALGVLGFVVTAKAEGGKQFRAVILSLGFGLFAITNAGGLWQAAGQRNSASCAVHHSETLLKNNPADRYVQEVLPYVTSPTQYQVLLVHIIADILIVGSIWTITLWPLWPFVRRTP